MEYTATRFEAAIDVQDFIRDYIDVEAFLACCRECPNYGQLWTCPPYDFDPLNVWRRYDTLQVYGYQVTCRKEADEPELLAVHEAVKQRIQEELSVMESQNPGSMLLAAGSCEVCKRCTRPEGKACRFPEKIRFSIESIGGNVSKTVEDLCGIRLDWTADGSMPDHFVMVGGLLRCA